MTLFNSHKEIYNVPGSGWTSPQWNWGSAMGTGHDCAMICRDRYKSQSARISLIENLLSPSTLKGDLAEVETLEKSLLVKDDVSLRDPAFEEVKLILGLAWQNGRWDGSDGGIGGYGEVLREMARADRYEGGDDYSACAECNMYFIEDVCTRFHLIAADDQVKEMQAILENVGNDIDSSRRKCAGMVLKAMGFIEKGL